MLRSCLLIVFSLFLSCDQSFKSEADKATVDLEMESSDTTMVATVDFEGLRPLINGEKDQVQVINFWATWCKPCLKELPYFERLQKEYKEELNVVLVSLDFPEQLNERLIPFLNKRNIQAEVILLDDPDANTWIPKVDKDWSGAIPATLIVKGDRRQFYERPFTYEELEEEVKRFIQ